MSPNSGPGRAVSSPAPSGEVLLEARGITVRVRGRHLDVRLFGRRRAGGAAD